VKHSRELEGGGASPRELAMIRAARVERAPARAREKTLSALGLGGAIGSTAVVLHAAESAADGAVGSAAAVSGAKAAASGALIMGKWIAIGAITGFASLATGERVVGLVHERQASPSPAAVPRGVIGGVVAAPRAAGDGLVPPTVVGPSVPVSSPPPPVLAGAAPRRSGQSAGGETPSRSSRAADWGTAPSAPVATASPLDEIRSALASKSPDEAERKLEGHRRKFAGGWLGEEALILQIETWVALGKRADATALAQKFLAEHPRSPYVDRVRATVATGGDTH